MRTDLKGKEEPVVMLTKRLSRRNPSVTITYLSNADDIAIITNQIEQAQEFLTSVEFETKKIGLKLNSNKKNDGVQSSHTSFNIIAKTK